MDKVLPHQFTFRVVRKSMQTRYMMEMFYYFLIVAVFQLNLTYFTSAWNNSIQFFMNIKPMIVSITAAYEAGDHEAAEAMLNDF